MARYVQQVLVCRNYLNNLTEQFDRRIIISIGTKDFDGFIQTYLEIH